MSPPPPPPPFEIRDLPLRSSSSGRGSFAIATAPAANTATTRAADTAIASGTTSTTTSNSSTGTSVPRNICWKDLDLNVSGTPASKKRRGPVIGVKTHQMVRVGGKIVVKYSDEHRGPAIDSLISHDIGSCVRDRVPVLAETYAELPKDHRQIVFDYLSVNYIIKRLQPSITSSGKATASDISRPMGRTSLLSSFIGRSSGSTCCNTSKTPFLWAKKQELKGAPAPHVEAYVQVYEKNGPQIEKMRARVTTLVEEQRVEHPLGDEETAIALSLASQVSVIEGEIGATRGTTVSVLGRSGRKLPKERGGALSSASESILVEKVKSQEEQLQAANERIRQLEGQYADIHDIVRQLKEARDTTTGSNTSHR